MRKRAWVHQRESQIHKHGKDKAAWLVDWIDPRGRRRRQSCGPGAKGKRDAQKLAEKIHSQLVTGTYENRERTTWAELVKLYEERELAGCDPLSADTARRSLASFANVAKPTLVRLVSEQTLEDFVRRRLRPTVKDVDAVAPATVNRELRYVRRVLSRAKKWKIITDVPEFPFVDEPERVPTYVPPDHFAAIYQACEAAARPKRMPNVSPAAWWRALLVFAYMTGWRIGSILKLEWENVDLVNGTAFSPAKANKGKRDELVPLHPLIVEHLATIKGTFSTVVFPWEHGRRHLWSEFDRIQAVAKLNDGSPMPKAGKRRRWYGFHDLRRGFATQNAGQMDLFELQLLMQHRDLETTRGYVNMANRAKRTTDRIFVPDLGKVVNG